MKRRQPDQHQLKIRFDQDNPLAMRLRQGEFSVIFEFDSPSARQPFANATAMSTLLAKRLAALPWVAALAVTDRLVEEDTHDPVAVAARLGEASGKPVVMNLSGRGSSPKRLRELAARAHSEGVQSILAVTGDLSPNHPKSSSFNRSPRYPEGYRDSVDTISELAVNYPKTLIGGGVNPFKYNLPDQYLQYGKMLRKAAEGAGFITAHIGWDMKKLQELQWFLRMREVELPVIARLPILSRERVHQLHNGFQPGVLLSRPFCAMLQREAEISEAQSMAAQLRRLALQAAGCRLLGFSGLQIVGVRDEQTLNLVGRAINETTDGIETCADWIEAWQSHHAGVEFAPAPNAYYMFDELMRPETPVFAPEQPHLAKGEFPAPLPGDRTRYRLLELRRRAWLPGWFKQALRRRFCQDCQEHAVDPGNWFHLCPKSCPKRLVHGPCGGSREDGLCEFGHATCFHHRILALAAERKALYRLEEAVRR